MFCIFIFEKCNIDSMVARTSDRILNLATFSMSFILPFCVMSDTDGSKKYKFYFIVIIH